MVFSMPEPPSGELSTEKSALSRAYGLIGITATLLGNLAAILTHFDAIRSTIFNWLGIQFLDQLHRGYIYTFMVVIGTGYLLCSIWAYKVYVSKLSNFVQ